MCDNLAMLCYNLLEERREMPLSKARMRQRKKLDRLNVKPMSNLNKLEYVKPKIEGLVIEGNRIIAVKPKYEPLPNCPNGRHRILTEYNKHEFSPGDRVLVKKGKRLVETVVPVIDGEGNSIPEY